METFEKKRFVLHTLRATATLGLAAATSMASAAPLTELFFAQLSGFSIIDGTGEPKISNVSEFGQSNPNSVGDSIPGETVFEQISWKGTSFDVSSALFFENFTSDTSPIRFDAGFAPDADGSWNEGDFWVIDTVTHFNEEIGGGNFAGAPLWVGDTVADFSVFSDVLGGTPLVTDPDSRGEVAFAETLNSATNCPLPSPFFDGNGPLLPTAPTAPGCDDYFDVDLNTAALVSDPVDGFVYEINFTLIPGNTFIGQPDGFGGNTFTNVGEVLICGVGFGCAPQYDPAVGIQRVYTPEYGANVNNTDFGVSSINIAAFWTARQVPTPAPLMLIGAGLLGMTLRRSHKRSA